MLLATFDNILGPIRKANKKNAEGGGVGELGVAGFLNFVGNHGV